MPKSSRRTDNRSDTPEQWREWVAAALACRIPVGHCLPAGDQPSSGRDFRPAAVLVGIVAEPVPCLYLTERSATLAHHPGQISFPGGRIEPADATPEAAALREAREEIGLAPEAVTILGRLPRYRTVTGFDIRPVVGWIGPGAQVNPDPSEVARLFTLPLAHALDASCYRASRRTHAGRRYDVYALDYGGDRIWGATAGMLVGFARRMARVRGRDFRVPETRAATADGRTV